MQENSSPMQSPEYQILSNFLSRSEKIMILATYIEKNNRDGRLSKKKLNNTQQSMH